MLSGLGVGGSFGNVNFSKRVIKKSTWWDGWKAIGAYECNSHFLWVCMTRSSWLSSCAYHSREDWHFCWPLKHIIYQSLRGINKRIVGGEQGQPKDKQDFQSGTAWVSVFICNYLGYEGVCVCVYVAWLNVCVTLSVSHARVKSCGQFVCECCRMRCVCSRVCVSADSCTHQWGHQVLGYQARDL